MLYFVQAETLGGYPLPPEQWMDLVYKHLEMIIELKMQEKILFHGGFVGRQAGFFVWNVNSHEELQNNLTRLPLWPFMDWAVEPVITTEAGLASLKESLAKQA